MSKLVDELKPKISRREGIKNQIAELQDELAHHERTIKILSADLTADEKAELFPPAPKTAEKKAEGK